MFFNKQVMLFDEDIKTSTEIITALADELKKKKIVKEEFLNHTLDREKNFPTGLATTSLGVAIPHTDSEFVNESPYEKAWMVKVELSDESQLDELLSAEQYSEMIGE